MSKKPGHAHHCEADSESDRISDCKSNKRLVQTLCKTVADLNIGPSGDYGFTVHPPYTVRTIFKGNSSRHSSGDSMDEDLYGLNDKFMEKLNLVRRKLNLIEISEDNNCIEDNDFCSRSSSVQPASTSDEKETDTSEPKGSTINQFYSIYQLNYINQNVEIPDPNCTDADCYYEITHKEVKKKGFKGWSVNLEENNELNTIFEVSSNIEMESSQSDYLQLTYNPPKKKICKRVQTPVLSPYSNSEHIELPYSLRVGIDTELLKTRSRHFLDNKSTQYCGADILDGDATHSFMDIDKNVEGTQIELLTKYEDSVAHVVVDKKNMDVNSRDDTASYVHLMPEVQINSFGSESPTYSNSPDLSPHSPYNPETASINSDKEKSVPSSDCCNQFHLDLKSNSYCSSSAESFPSQCNGGDSCEEDTHFKKNSLVNFSPLNVPFEQSSGCNKNVTIATVTTLRNLKSKSADAKLSKFSRKLKPKVSDSCVEIQTIQKPHKTAKSKKRSRSSHGSSNNKNNSTDTRVGKRTKKSSLSSTDFSDSLSSEAHFENIAISPLITSSLDVPRMYIKKPKFPPVAYIASCFGQLTQQDLEKLIAEHESQKCKNDKNEWWNEIVKNSDSSDSYKEIAKQVIEINRYSVQDEKLLKEKQSEIVARNQKSQLACNAYNERKHQNHNLEFYELKTSPTEVYSRESSVIESISSERRRSRAVHFVDGQETMCDHNKINADRKKSDNISESDSDDNLGCWGCKCIKKIFTSRETQFFA